MNKELLDSIVVEAEGLLLQLLTRTPAKLEEIPATSGVYLAYDKDNRIIYVGEAVNLKRRIREDHLGGDEKMSTSTLRSNISKTYGIAPGKPIKDWMGKNCRFAYILIKDHDLKDLVEILAIAYIRKSGETLLNFHRNLIAKKLENKA